MATVENRLRNVLAIAQRTHRETDEIAELAVKRQLDFDVKLQNLCGAHDVGELSRQDLAALESALLAMMPGDHGWTFRPCKSS